MTATQTTIDTLINYFELYERGELNNAPASLICKYLADNLDSDDEQSLCDKIAIFVNETDLSSLGFGGELGGVNLTSYVTHDVVEYVTGEDCTWICADELMRLAKEADVTGDPSPLPEWFEYDWRDISGEYAKDCIMNANEDDIIMTLTEQGITISKNEEDEDEPEYRVGFQWFSCPRTALLEFVENLSKDRVREVIKSIL